MRRASLRGASRAVYRHIRPLTIHDCEHAGKSLSAVAELLIHQIRKREAFYSAAGIAEHHELLRIANREMFQQQRVHNTENRRIRADTKRKSEHGHSGEALMLEQHSYAITQVLNHFVLPSLGL